MNKTGETPSAAVASEDEKANFIHYNCLTLPHLIALISRPTAKSLPQDVTLVVLSSLTALINSALPKSQDERPGARRKHGPDQSSKRRQGLQSIMKALQAMASARNCAVVLLSQCATKMRSERQATLIPSVTASVWEHGISTRIVLFKDWDTHRNNYASIFLAGIQKLDGKPTQEAVEHVSAFRIETVSGRLPLIRVLHVILMKHAIGRCRGSGTQFRPAGSNASPDDACEKETEPHKFRDP